MLNGPHTLLMFLARYLIFRPLGGARACYLSACDEPANFWWQEGIANWVPVACCGQSAPVD